MLSANTLAVTPCNTFTTGPNRCVAARLGWEGFVAALGSDTPLCICPLLDLPQDYFFTVA